MATTEDLNEKKGLVLSLLLCFILFCILSFSSESMFDAGDGIQHYLISRYSWDHPHLFLHSWGKPFFTATSSPFSQFGFSAITLFNILCGIASAYLTYKVAKKLNYNNALLTLPFLLFAPVYFPAMNSGLTEPFFGLVLVGSIFLMLEKKHIAAAVLVSFLPFVRSEGFILLPLFFIVLIYNRSFIAALLLSFGTLFYSFIGFLYWGDFFWIKTQNPYINGQTYGTGSIWSFVQDYDFIWGGVLGVLFVLGILCIVSRTFPYKNKPDDRKGLASLINIETVLILGSFVVYFCAHSYLWWKGLGNSMGLTRVLAAVFPCSALVCVRGFNLVMPEILFRNKIVKYSIVGIVLFFVVLKPFRSDNFPYKFTPEQVVIKEAADWIVANDYDQQKMYYLYPYLPLLLDIDPFDTTKVADLWALYSTIANRGISSIPDSTLVIWDAHFGPNECGMPLEKIKSDPNFDLLKSFYPKERFTTLGDYPFSVHVFMKRKFPKIGNSLKTASEIPFPSGDINDVLNKDREFGTALVLPISQFPKQTEKVTFKTRLVSGGVGHANALVVLVIDGASGKNVFWEGKPLAVTSDSTNSKTITVDFPVSIDSFQPTDVVKIYVWNKEKKEFVLQESTMTCWKY